ncbi:Nuclear pore complex protein [Oopsacas minuta]|uniref:Nuclear pore complex protein n=1 Tax=Oopsacas minuta TaxID=111878 RepID=A0AAV7JUX8_9METZ|nr:Nuclear pore complex protein [Oopsacas minuta]
MANYPVTYTALPLNDLPDPIYRHIEVAYPEEQRRKTLQLPSCAGGFSYTGSDNYRNKTVRSRFIIWRYDENHLELIEYSTDYNLEGNALKFEFINCELIGRVSIYESEDLSSIQIAIPTSTRIIRIVLLHPLSLHDIHSDVHSSIFYNVTSHILADVSASYPLPQAFLSHTLVAIATGLINNILVCTMGSSDGSVFGVRFPAHREHIFTPFELKQTGIMSRIISGFIRKSEATSQENTLSSMRILNFNGRAYILQIFRDCKLKLLHLDRKECILNEDLSNHLNNYGCVNQIEPMIELSQTIDSGVQKICILITTNTLAIFLTYDLHLDLAAPVLQHLSSNFSTLPTNSKLLQFSFSNENLYTLWLSRDDESTIVETLNTGGKNPQTNGWLTFNEISQLPNELEIPDIKDIQETYLSYICNTKYMRVQCILNALTLFEHTPPQILTHAALKTAIIQAVEKEIHHLVTLPQLQNQLRRALQLQVWSKFYQACLQYQTISCYPLGLIANKGIQFLIGKRSLIFYAPIQLLEQIYLQPKVKPCLQAIRILSIELIDKIKYVLGMARKISNCFVGLELHLRDLLDNDADIVGFVGYLLDCMLIADREVCRSESPVKHSEIRASIGKIQPLIPALQAISDLLKFPLSEAFYTHCSLENTENIESNISNISTLYTSELSISILNANFRDLVARKKEVCWSILLLSCFVLREKATNAQSQENEAFTTLKSFILPELITSLISLHLLQNLSQFKSKTHNINSTMYSSESQNVSITQTVYRILPLQYATDKCLHEILLKLHTRNVLPSEELIEPVSTLQYILCEYTNAICESVSPGLSAIKFLTYMYDNRYLSELLYTLHVLESLYNPVLVYPIRLYRAQYYLKVGKVGKSVQIFLSTISGMLSVVPDPFLYDIVADKVEETKSNCTVLYFLYLIDLFEQEQAPDMIIRLAKHALEIAPADEQLMSNLWSIQFKHSLDLCLYEEAYVAMISNPEQPRRKDCMKRFVIELCTKKKYKLLCAFSYSGVEKEIEDVLESRARSADPMTGNYYSLLHTFYSNRGNYRRAAVAMYECVMRLNGEMATLLIIQKQAKCYLAAINALYLVDDKSAFVLKPRAKVQAKKPLDNPPDSKKMRENVSSPVENEIDASLIPRVEVVSLEDLEDEYLLVLAQLKLAQVEETATPLTTSTCTREEIVILLVHYGLFDLAMTISDRLKLSKQQIFEMLATRCVKMAILGDVILEDTDGLAHIQWLSYNDTGIECCIEGLSHEGKAWNLLKRYLESMIDFEKIEAHLWVVGILLSLNYALPQWLKDDVSRIAPEKLLAMYLKYSQLEDAGQFALAYIRAVLGDRKENEQRGAEEKFGLKYSLKSIDPETGTYNTVKLPYTYIDILLSELKKKPEDSHLHGLYEALEMQLQDYFTELEQASKYLILLKKKSSKQHLQESQELNSI